jgi:hypothetical protein
VSGFLRSLRLASLAALGGASRVGPARQALRSSFARKLVSLRGLPMKLGQILSMLPGDADLAAIHAEAQKEAEALPQKEAQELLEHRSPKLAALIREWHPGVWPASLGQVHRLSLHDGRDAAVKLRYPEAEEMMDLDAGLFDFVTATFGRFRQGFALDEYRRVLGEELRLELDYCREARLQEEFHRLFAAEAGIVIPRPMTEFDGPGLICSSWESGLRPDDFASGASREERVAAASLVCRFYLVSLLRGGLLHADPNPGNLALRRGASGVELVVYDYGSASRLEPAQRLGLIALFRSVCRGDLPALAALRSLGFDLGVLRGLEAQLPDFLAIQLEPLVSPCRYDFKDWNRAARSEALLGPRRLDFMTAAPPSLFLVMRAFQGLYHYLQLLGTGCYCRPLVDQLVAEAAPELQALMASLPAEIMEAPRGLAGRQLRVEVREMGELKVAVTLPGSSLDNLGELLDDDLKSKLVRRGLDVDGIAAESRRRGHPPALLFDLVENGRSCRVELI